MIGTADARCNGRQRGEHGRMAWACALILPAVFIARGGEAADAFKDPAPPVCAGRSTTPGPAAQPNPDARFHAAPKPLAPVAVTSDWPSLLGPAHDMTSPETCLLADFSNGPPALVWEVKKGDGYAAPAIAEGRLVLFHRVGDEAVVDCLDAADGRRFWRFAFPTAYRDRYGYNHGPRCSPVIADGRVFAHGADGNLFCLELADGRLLWRRDLLKEFGLKPNFFGVGSTPLVEDGRLIVNVGAPGGPCVAAFDVRTGALVWGAGRDWGPSYAAPVPATFHGRRRVLVFAGGESDPATGGLLAVDPADGRIAFTFPWRGTRYESVNGSAPAVVGNRVFISECYGAGGALLDVQKEGGCALVWTNKDFGTHFMTAVHKDGFLYGVDGHGPGDAYLTCAELATGRIRWRAKPLWPETVVTADGPREITCGILRGWFLMVDGRCLCLGEQGHLLWLDLNPAGYRETSRTRLFVARDAWSPPVLSRGLLYICQNQPDSIARTPPRLLCYDLRGDAK